MRMSTLPNNASLYGSQDGYQKVVAHYDRTIDSMGIVYDDVYVDTRFGPTHILVCGNEKGKPIVLWHGQNANASTWAKWVPALVQNYHIYAVDTIGGMGKSAVTRLNRSGSAYGEWAADVVGVIGLH